VTALNTQPGADCYNAGAGWTGLYFSETARDGLVANPGGGQTNALLLPCMFNRVITVTNPGDSVKLPPALPGLDILVLNVGGNPMTVYGSNQDQIDGAAAGVAVTQMNNSMVLYSCYGPTSGWASEGLATGFAASGLQTLSPGSYTASTTHTQAGATPITTMMAAVTVNNASDATILSAAVPGLQMSVANLSATLAGQMYANGTDTINGTAGSTGVSLTANAVTIYFCIQSGKWLTK
jgi:hypothetical protein